MPYTKEDTIFVQIASYRDPELQYTIKNLFEKAKKPENIFVGICHQYDMKGDEDKNLFEIPFSHPKQLRIDKVDYRESKGCCWARNRVQKLWNGEKWTLQIDSHIVFKKHWDEILINNMKKLKDNNAIITQVLPGYTLPDRDITSVNYGTCTCDLQKLLRTYSTTKQTTKKNTPICIMYAAFRFGASSIIQQHIINPILKYQDETPSSVDLWLRGANLYNYNDTILWHLWLSDKEDRRVNKARNNTFINDTNEYVTKYIKHFFNIKKQKI